MLRLKKRGLYLFMTLALLLGLCAPAAAVSEKTLSEHVSTSAKYILSKVNQPQVGSVGGEWAVIGLARSGHDVPQEYWDDYYAAVEDYVEARKGVLHTKKYTEYSRVALALTAIGADPTDVAGYNLLTPLGNFDKTTWQGINGPVWALIALDSGSYDMPVNTEAKTQATRQMYIDEILRRQLSDGGWNLIDEGGDGQADPDVTGMALQALAKYQTQTAVQTATDRALDCLSKMQDADGGYASWEISNSESVVQVIVALCELGIDLNDHRFVKNGNTLLDNLLRYQQANGSFAHTASGSGSNLMASEQGFYGIVAAMRAAQNKNSLYRMSDCAISLSGDQGADTIGLPDKHADVQKNPIVAPSITFADISAHENRAAIEALAARGIVAGYNANSFGPNDTMTRAQFATMVVRALGLPLQTTDTFTDVTPDAWYAAFVGSAYTYEITSGKTATLFDPNGTITRQEAAVMVARAAKLCGMDTGLETYEILNAIAQFGDYVTIGAWARESMAFCYSEGILDQNDLNVNPFRPILRCEMAQMLYNLLDSAKLL